MTENNNLLAAFMVPHPPLIVPAVGRGGEKSIEETTRAYERVADEIAALKPDTIIITSPHSVMYSDYFHISPGKGASGNLGDFGARGVRFDVEYDTELVDRICEIALVARSIHAADAVIPGLTLCGSGVCIRNGFQP